MIMARVCARESKSMCLLCGCGNGNVVCARLKGHNVNILWRNVKVVVYVYLMCYAVRSFMRPVSKFHQIMTLIANILQKTAAAAAWTTILKRPKITIP
jgi:hypothetical protein